MFVYLGYMYYYVLCRIHCLWMDTKAVKAKYKQMALKLYIWIETVC